LEIAVGHLQLAYQQSIYWVLVVVVVVHQDMPVVVVQVD
jgi:hypothetical protein